jgi:hypothetical protein
MILYKRGDPEVSKVIRLMVFVNGIVKENANGKGIENHGNENSPIPCAETIIARMIPFFLCFGSPQPYATIPGSNKFYIEHRASFKTPTE